MSVHHASHHQTGEGGWRGIQRTYVPKNRRGYLASSVMLGGTLKLYVGGVGSAY